MIDKIIKIFYSGTAALGFELSGIAVNDRGEMPEDGILCFSRQKSSIKFRLDELFNRMPPSGFFTPIAAASAALYSLPTWAGCTEYIGRRMPLGASLANLVKVSRNLCKQSGKLFAMRKRINPSSALGLQSLNAGGAGSKEVYTFFAPLNNLLSKGLLK